MVKGETGSSTCIYLLFVGPGEEGTPPACRWREEAWASKNGWRNSVVFIRNRAMMWSQMNMDQYGYAPCATCRCVDGDLLMGDMMPGLKMIMCVGWIFSERCSQLTKIGSKYGRNVKIRLPLCHCFHVYSYPIYPSITLWHLAIVLWYNGTAMSWVFAL